MLRVPDKADTGAPEITAANKKIATDATANLHRLLDE
jgi:hypothetical protein